MNNILSMFGNSPATGRANGEQPNGSPGLRGTKRKAKIDPYDDIDEDDEPQRTPVSQRSKPRISSETPNSSSRGRLSAGKIKRRSRSSMATGNDSPVQGSRVDAAANLARAREPDAARLQADPEDEAQGNPLVPVADMGGSGPLENSTADAASNNTDKDQSENNPKPASKATPKGKGKTTARPEPESKPEADRVEDDLEEHEIASLLKHRMASDGSGVVEFLVHWVGEKEEDATWELEEEIQRGAEESLYDYWKSQGGRLHALFIKPKNPPPEIYHVFKVLRHEKKARGGFQFEVQWVGHPATRGETSTETEVKLKNIAPEQLAEYWKSIGGREKHLAKRGRGKRTRTE
ncbi:hypothetical protein F5X99DRAFT_108697 [Biscogniauxia marginata]|nr:hypothetical protein F5X99DRAFT_108697 [Biscogniauxia marginata]